MKKRPNLQNLVVLLILLVIGVGMNYFKLNEFPQSKHAWAQADRYALAVGYLNNGMHLFEPETMVMNNQFPNNWNTEYTSSRTSTDIPLFEYCIAILMKLFHSHSVWIFRCSTLLLSIIGLLYLFKLFRIFGSDFSTSIVLTVFAATSPLFIFYQVGFLPSISSLSLIFIGIYFYNRYLKNGQQPDFIWAVLWLTLATITRTTYAIPLIAIVGNEFIRVLFFKKQIPKTWIPILISLVLILILQYLKFVQTKEFGSVFLAQPVPPKSLKHFFDLILIAKQYWGKYYFSESHYYLYVLMIVFFVYQWIAKKLKTPKIQFEVASYIAIYFIGVLAFASLMLKQFRNHDYYFLDTLYIPVLVLLGYLIGRMSINEKSKIGIILKSLIGIALLWNSYNIHGKEVKRFSDIKSSDYYESFVNSKEFLDSLNIPNDSKILVIGTNVPNMSFLMMERKGFVIINTKAKNIENALTWNFDYIVTANSKFIEDVYVEYPEILKRIKRIASNDGITLSKLQGGKNVVQPLTDFIGVDTTKTLYEASIDFEMEQDQSSKWFQTNRLKLNDHNFVGFAPSDKEFGIGYRSNFDGIQFSTPRTIAVNGQFKLKNLGETIIVVSAKKGNEFLYYKAYPLEQAIITKNKWVAVVNLFQFPVINEPFEFSVYLWNKGKVDVYYDNIGFTIY